jgi:polyhydroxyalkanoate synthesis regulator phasin
LYKDNTSLAERMATTVEMNQGAPAADTNDAQVIDILKTAVGEPDGKLSQTDSANINGVPQDSGSKPTETSSNSDPAQMQETITALKTEVEQLREKLK